MKEIMDIIDEKIRPILKARHGDISRVQVTPEGFVKLKLTGACSACPSARQTLSEFIEAVIQEACPQIKGVISDCETSADLISEALGILRKSSRQNHA